jgi:hypothetical protein
MLHDGCNGLLKVFFSSLSVVLPHAIRHKVTEGNLVLVLGWIFAIVVLFPLLKVMKKNGNHWHMAVFVCIQAVQVFRYLQGKL